MYLSLYFLLYSSYNTIYTYIYIARTSTENPCGPLVRYNSRISRPNKCPHGALVTKIVWRLLAGKFKYG